MLEQVIEKFSYYPESGVVISNPTNSQGFVTTSGYIGHSLRRGKQVYAHRIAWIISEGPIPDGMVVDHINGDRKDNRKSNLRLVSAKENKRNRHRSKGKVQSKGVHFETSRNKFVANGMKEDGTTLYLGRYETEKEAAEAFAQHVRERGWGIA